MKRKRPSKEKLIEALRELDGNMAAVGRRLHADRRTVWGWVHSDQELEEVVEDETESFIDEAENVLYDAIRSGNIIATIFFLKTKARHRGYSERLELVPLNRQDIEVELGAPTTNTIEDSKTEALNGNGSTIALLDQ